MLEDLYHVISRFSMSLWETQYSINRNIDVKLNKIQ